MNLLQAKHRSRSAPVLFILLATVPALRAETSSGDLASLLAEALDRNPEVLAAQKRYEAARQRPSQVSSLPDPMLSPSYASVGRPWPGAGLGEMPMARIGFMASQEIPYPGKRKLMGDMAEKEAGAAFQDYQQVQLDVVARLKQAYYRRSWAFAAADVLNRNIELLRKLLQIAEARYSAGKAQQQDLFKTQTQISILQTKKMQVEREAHAREAEIVSLLNRAPTSTLPQPAPLEAQEFDATPESLIAAARANSPVLRRDERMTQKAELAVSLARKDYYPDVTVRGGYYNMGGSPPLFEAGVDIKVPLYFFRKQRPAVTEKSQDLIATRRMYQADAQSLIYRIRDDQLMAKTSADLAKVYQDTVIPQASLALESSLSSYETGAVDFLTVLMNYIAVLEYEMNYYDELQNFYTAASRLEELTGQAVLR